jgi:hypothetical protein
MLIPIGRNELRARGTQAASHRHHLEKTVEPFEVVRVARVERELVGHCRRGDRKVKRAATSRLALRTANGGVDAPVGAGEVPVQRERLEGRLRSLEPVLAPSTFGGIVAPLDRVREDVTHS